MVRVGSQGTGKGSLGLRVLPGLQMSLRCQCVQGVGAITVRGMVEGQCHLLKGGVWSPC